MTRIMDPIPRFTEPTPTEGPAPSHSPPDVRYVPGNRLARGLGWFSIGLGLAEIMMPETVADIAGVSTPQLMPLYGLREVACGIGILSCARPTEWLWARVAGDAVDIATVAGLSDSQRRGRAGMAALALLGVTALDVLCATQLSAAASMEG